MFCSYYSAAFLQSGEDTVYSFDPLRIPYGDLFKAKVFENQKESFNQSDWWALCSNGAQKGSFFLP